MSVKPQISESLAAGIRLMLPQQGGGRAEEFIDILNRALEIAETTATTAIFDEEILQLNNGGSTANLTGAGLVFEGDAAAIVGYMRVGSADISVLQLKAPTGFVGTFDFDADSTLTMSAGLNVSGVSAINQNVTTTGAPTFTSIQLGATITVSSILDEDNLASDSATALVTQQSVKKYIDDQVGASNELSEILANGNSTGGNSLVLTSGDTIASSSGASQLDLRAGGIDSQAQLGNGTQFVAITPAAVQLVFDSTASLTLSSASTVLKHSTNVKATLVAGGITLDSGNGTDIINLFSATGIEIGALTGKVAFFGAAPVVKVAATRDLKTTLVDYGLYTDGSATPLDLEGGAVTASSYIVGANQVVGAQAAAEADPGAITNYVAHASGAVTVTSNAATDLDTTASALATLEDEVTALRASYVSLLAKVRTHGLIAT